MSRSNASDSVVFQCPWRSKKADSVNPDANAKRTDAVPGDLRLPISVLDGKPVAVLYR